MPANKRTVVLACLLVAGCTKERAQQAVATKYPNSIYDELPFSDHYIVIAKDGRMYVVHSQGVVNETAEAKAWLFPGLVFTAKADPNDTNQFMTTPPVQVEAP